MRHDDDEPGRRQQEYEEAFEAIEERARRGELTLQQVRHAIHALRRRLHAGQPMSDDPAGTDTS